VHLYGQVGWKRYPWAAISIFTILVVVLSYAYAVGIDHIFKPTLSPDFEEFFMGRERNPLLVMSVLLSAALVEEIQFRMIGLGLVGWGLRRWLGRDCPWLGILIVSLVWAFGHTGFLVEPFLKEFHIFFVGIILGYMVRRYGATSSIIAHMCLNIMSAGDVLFV
jgi:membrane protease YdiL (CAAX protease family)